MYFRPLRLSAFAMTMAFLPFSQCFQVSLPQRHSPAVAAPALAYSIAADPPVSSDSGFQERMKKLIAKPTSSSPPTTTTRRSNIEQVTTIQDYKRVVADERNRLTIVRFYAPWCAACKRSAPLFERLARQHPEIQFVQVPVGSDTTKLIQGLGVESIPFGHIYHPQAGLVEELSVSKKNFKDFNAVVDSYVAEACALGELDPYTHTYKSPFARAKGGRALTQIE